MGDFHKLLLAVRDVLGPVLADLMETDPQADNLLVPSLSGSFV